MNKSAIIVGGGHNGLVCACYLAKADLQITILERRHLVGGAAVTEEFFPGFRNSTASYTVSLLHPRVIADLNLGRHGLTILTRPVDNFLPLLDGSSFSLFPDIKRTSEEVLRFSATDANRLTDYYALLASVGNLVRSQLLKAPPRLLPIGFTDLIKGAALGNLYRQLSSRHKRYLMKFFLVSAGELLDDWFESDPIKAVFGFDSIVGNYASPYTPGSAYVLLHHTLGEVNGIKGAWGHALGGMGAITQAMRMEAEALGVNIRTECEVTRINVKGARAVSVELANGEEIPGDIIVSNLHPKTLFMSLIERQHLDDEVAEHFNHYKSGSGSFRINLALDGLPEFVAAPSNQQLQAGIIMAPSLKYMDDAYLTARQDGWSRQPIVEMLIPSIVDETLAPTGKHVASLFCQQFDPQLDWDLHKDDAVKTILETVAQYAPNLHSILLDVQAHSPRDLERKFGLVDGDIFHGRLCPDQLYSARPMLGMGQYKTWIDRLYMCGAGTHPGGGVSGIPGYNSAKRIIKDLRSMR